MLRISMDYWNWNKIDFSKPVLLINIFILTITKFEASPASEKGLCSLKIQPSSLLNVQSCQEGDWDGLLHNNCCGSAFNAFLYALGQRANQTGKIFLNSTEQKNCLSEMKASKDDVFSCGIEKLKSGAGGCSDFSVDDVRNRLGKELSSLGENCQLQNEQVLSCPSCLITWKAIQGNHRGNTNNQAAGVEADICRIAVLVSLISSKIENDMDVHALQICLGGTNLNGGN